MTNSTTKPKRKLNSQLIDFIHRPVLIGQMARFSTVSEIRFVPRAEKLSETQLANLYACISALFDTDEARYLASGCGRAA
jgi:hypothetical protein